MAKKFFLCASIMLMVALAGRAIKILHGPYLQNVYQTEATIVWVSDKPNIGWVEMAPDDGTHFYGEERPRFYDTKIGVKRTDSLHAVRITNLKPGVTYRYRVFSREVLEHKGAWVQYGKITATDVYKQQPLTFTTLKENQEEVKFVVLNDVHARKEVITPLLTNANWKERDLIFFNGDMVSIVNKGEDFFAGFMDESIDLFAKEKAPYYVRGNHETRGEFATHFQDYFNPRQQNLYYGMHLGDVYFINLDTGEDKPDSDKEYSEITDYDQYRTDQALWLETLKDDPYFKAAKHRIVICHMPTTPAKEAWHGNVDCIKKFAPVLNTMNIDLMICGHEHRNALHPASENIKYPVLINSNNSSVEASVTTKGIAVTIRALDGKVVKEYKF